MKHLLLIFSLYFCSSEIIKSQSIFAGNYNVTDNYHNYNPDTIIKCAWSGGLCNSIDFPIDVNNDGIIDFSFKAKNQQGGMGSGDTYVQINALNNNQVAWGNTDTCVGSPFYTKMAKDFMLNEQIANFNMWEGATSIYVTRNYWFSGTYNCNINITDSSAIIGTRIFVLNDTLYGWIKLNNIYSHSYEAGFTIEEYACNKGTVGIIETKEENFFIAYPNPSKDKVFLKLSFAIKECVLTLFDLNGRELIREQINNNDTQIDISSLSKGIYYIKLINDNSVFVKKILKK